MKKLIFYSLLLALLLHPVLTLARGADNFLLLASTIGPVDAGIVPLLEESFEKETGIRVRHVGAGTGEALKLAEKGNFDLVLVHARSLEEKFVKNGFGTERIPLMYNDFVIVGPAYDPAGIRAASGAAAALEMIATKMAPFVSRGDKSGTHVAEMDLWTQAGLKPASPWYRAYEKGNEGNGPTLRYCDLLGAYTLIDRATYLSLKKEIKLVILVEKDPLLLNFISLIPVNPDRFGQVNAGDTKTFINWLVAPTRGQQIIRDFGVDKYGAPLFFPDSKEWRALQDKK
jgi:tungstate transport system substrate-binding protein